MNENEALNLAAHTEDQSSARLEESQESLKGLEWIAKILLDSDPDEKVVQALRLGELIGRTKERVSYMSEISKTFSNLREDLKKEK